MDIQGLSMAMAQGKVINQVSTAMLSKSMDTYEKSGQNLVKMMEQSVNPSVGKNVDIKL